MKRSM